MQQRPSSRLLVLDRDGRVLLFRFEHRNGPLAGQAFWATPGGGLEGAESYESAARRELLEEVGLEVSDPGARVARRITTFRLPTGETVEADERYFLINAGEHTVSTDGWSSLEREVMAEHRWWTRSELISTGE